MSFKKKVDIDTKQAQNGGNVLGLLGVLFVGLKLTGYINWSWWWVTAPFWGPFALLAVILIIALIFVGLATLIDKVK